MSFKVFIVVLASVAFVKAGTVGDKITQAQNFATQCIEETGIDPELAMNLKKADFSVRNEKAECFIKCLYEKIGFMDKEGNLQEDVFLNKIQNDDKKAELEVIIKKCISQTSDNKCELAFNIFECYWTARGTSLAKEFEKIKQILPPPPLPVPADGPPFPLPPVVASAE